MTQPQQAKDLLMAAAARQKAQRDAMASTSQDIAKTRAGEAKAREGEENQS